VQLHAVNGQESHGEHGEWLEYVNGTLCGRLSYRHQALPGGEWRIEEHHVFEQGSIFYLGGSQYHTRSVWLNPDFTLRQATYAYESFAGTERGEIAWTPEGGYVMHRTEIDGHEAHRYIKTPPVLPGVMLVQSLLPLFLKRKRHAQKAIVLPLLSMQEGAVSIQEMTIAAVHTDEQTGEQHTPPKN
jgi:hypothetical protein